MIWLYTNLLPLSVLTLGELTNQLLKVEREYVRKLVHTLSGLMVIAFSLAFGLSATAWLCILALPFILVARKWTLVQSVYQVGRVSIGEVLFPVGVIAAALLAQDVSSFVFSVLVLSFADSSASLIGNRFGTKGLSIFANRKSYAGSLTFLAVTFTLGLGFVAAGAISLPVLLILAISLTLVETICVFGTDNLALPVASVLLLQFLVA